MSDSGSVVAPPPVVVWGPEPDDPPFRLVEVNGALVGKAHGIADVVTFILRAGLKDFDVEDPMVVRWVNGGPYDWMPH
ncbi:hypothetical protein [Streptomyces sp. bgisy100]|uniref:hypothetical protein n=1 Tax=Streptomyces sp. bgisy100 TaxID=3413783 RepID=UPI003D7599B4